MEEGKEIALTRLVFENEFPFEIQTAITSTCIFAAMFARIIHFVVMRR